MKLTALLILLTCSKLQAFVPSAGFVLSRTGFNQGKTPLVLTQEVSIYNINQHLVSKSYETISLKENTWSISARILDLDRNTATTYIKKYTASQTPALFVEAWPFARSFAELKRLSESVQIPLKPNLARVLGGLTWTFSSGLQENPSGSYLAIEQDQFRVKQVRIGAGGSAVFFSYSEFERKGANFYSPQTKEVVWPGGYAIVKVVSGKQETLNSTFDPNAVNEVTREFYQRFR